MSARLSLNVALLFFGALVGLVCTKKSSADEAIEGYRLYSAQRFAPRGYQCRKACRCLEIHVPLNASVEELRQVERARLALRGFAAPELEETVPACNPADAIARCQIPAKDSLPERMQAPDIQLRWYDAEEIGLDAAREDCTAEGFVVLE